MVLELVHSLIPFLRYICGVYWTGLGINWEKAPKKREKEKRKKEGCRASKSEGCQTEYTRNTLS